MRSVRTKTRVPLFAVLTLSLALGATACGRATASSDRGVVSRTEAPAPVRKAADPRELAGYAERERQVQGLEKFAGGRMSNSDLTTIVLVLLIVVLILIII
jgi:hypothetical protein